MKHLIALAVLFFSIAAHAVPGVSPEVSRACAQLMGDVVYFQVDNSARSREKMMNVLGRAEAEAAKGQTKGDALAVALTEGVRRLLQSQVNRSPYDVGKYKEIVDTYESIVEAYSPEVRRDQAFLMLDLRYRYLSKTLATVNDGTIASAPLLRSLEEAFEDTDKAMKLLGAKNPGAASKWGFLRVRVLDYNTSAIPALANNMTLRIAEDVKGGTSAMVVSASR